MSESKEVNKCLVNRLKLQRVVLIRGRVPGYSLEGLGTKKGERLHKKVETYWNKG